MRIKHEGFTPVLEVGPRDPVPVTIKVIRPGLISGKPVEFSYRLVEGKPHPPRRRTEG